MYERIVAGTDFSSTANVATDRASLLASRLGAQLVLVHAGREREQLEEIAAGYGAEAVVADGTPADVLISYAQADGPSLLVVGSVGMRGARRFLLGSVPNKVSHHAGNDLLIVRTDIPSREVREYRKILVGTDGSPTAMRAVDTASKLAARLSADEVIVCAYEPPSEQELAQMRADPGDAVAQWKVDRSVREIPQEFRWRIAGASQAEDVLDRAAQHASDQGVDARVQAVEGDAAEALIETAERERCDVIVVGSVGMSGAKRFMLGNVPNRVSHHAPTDVLILQTT